MPRLQSLQWRSEWVAHRVPRVWGSEVRLKRLWNYFLLRRLLWIGAPPANDNRWPWGTGPDMLRKMLT